MIRVVLAVAAVLAGAAAAQTGRWQQAAPLQVPRTELGGAVAGREIVVVGGFLENGQTTAQADAYSPADDRWRRLRSLPVPVNHPLVVSSGNSVYVIGGYSGGDALRAAFVFERGVWRRLPTPPAKRAAGGAAVVAGKLYAVGGVGPSGLARNIMIYDLRSRRWTFGPGPTPREHLGVATLGGRIYAVAGRTAGIDTNLDLTESWAPGARTWSRHAPVPDPRGGTALAAGAQELFSVGGEEPQGTIGEVYAYRPASDSWRRLPDLPTTRHGLAAVVFGGRLHVIGGGPVPGLTVSGANEVLPLD